MYVEIQKFTRWLRCKSPHTSTHRHYASDLRLFFTWANKTLAAITVSDVDAYIAHCQTRGHAVATINRRLAALSAFYRFLQTHAFDFVLTAGYTGLMKGSPVTANIKIPGDQIAAFCRRHHIRQLALFGSVLRPDFGPDSDVDVLVEFEPGADETLTLLDLAGMQLELSNLFQRDVDLVLRDGLKPLLKDEVLNTLEVVYAV